MIRLLALLSALVSAVSAAPLFAQDSALPDRVAVEASAPSRYAVTVYRDPEREVQGRSVSQPMDADWPRGFGMISETRTVTLPPGRSTILFEGVAEGMVAVSAIVTGLPGGTIEKNRNAELLSPAALVNGLLGNRVTITRTNPGTGVPASEQAVVRTRADGGLVLQTGEGYEAVRCSGLPERLTFPRVPKGLSAEPVYSIDTFDPAGGTYEVVLTYIAWGFDWEANYVAYLGPGQPDGSFDMALQSWLSVVNDNGQSFEDAELLAVAGKISVESDFEDLSDAPEAPPLRLVCYPIGSTATGSPIPDYDDYGPPMPVMAPPPPPQAIVVTGSRIQREDAMSASPISVVSEEAMAREEQLGDLKLYRVPRPVTVASKGMKQVAFLAKKAVDTRFVYRAPCYASDRYDPNRVEAQFEQADILLVTKNDRESGLGAALPMGEVVFYQASEYGPQVVAQRALRDYPVGQDIELAFGESAQVSALCARLDEKAPDENRRRSWTRMRTVLTNANSSVARVRLDFGWPGDWEVRWPGQEARVKNGALSVEVDVPANDRLEIDWRIRPTKSAWSDLKDSD